MTVHTGKLSRWRKTESGGVRTLGILKNAGGSDGASQVPLLMAHDNSREVEGTRRRAVDAILLKRAQMSQ
jgi:hypothetical protein